MKKNITVLAFVLSVSMSMQAQLHKAPNMAPTKSTIVPTKTHSQNLFAKAPTTLWQDNTDESWYNDTATEFTLSTPAQVAGLAKIVNAGNNFSGKTIIIGADMDFGAHLWMPIGKGYQFPFSGIIKGNNHKISNLFINLPNGDFVGFVGQMFQGKISDLNAENVTITAKDTTGSIVGNLSTNSTMENCHAKNVNIQVSGYNAGGLVGGILTDSSIMNSSAEGSVTGVNQIGGLAGTLWDKTSITNSYAKGTVSGEYIVGGFAGYSTMAFGPNRNNVVTDCYTRANVYASSERAGGFYGGPEMNAITKNVYSTGTVTSSSAVGGYAGFVAFTEAENIYYDFTNAPIDPIGMFNGPPQTYDIHGLPTADMKTQALADALNASRPVTMWYYDATKNDGYPILEYERMLAAQNTAIKSKVQVYPTVITQFLNVKNSAQNSSYSIIDFSGRILKSGILVNSQIDLSSLSAGNYIVLLSQNGQLSQHKIIKK